MQEKPIFFTHENSCFWIGDKQLLGISICLRHGLFKMFKYFAIYRKINLGFRFHNNDENSMNPILYLISNCKSQGSWQPLLLPSNPIWEINLLDQGRDNARNNFSSHAKIPAFELETSKDEEFQFIFGMVYSKYSNISRSTGKSMLVFVSTIMMKIPWILFFISLWIASDNEAGSHYYSLPTLYMK